MEGMEELVGGEAGLVQPPNPPPSPWYCGGSGLKHKSPSPG